MFHQLHLIQIFLIQIFISKSQYFHTHLLYCISFFQIHNSHIVPLFMLQIIVGPHSYFHVMISGIWMVTK